MTLSDRLRITADSWINNITGVGSSSARTGFRFVSDTTLSDEVLTALFRGDSFARRIVEIVPTHSTRQGYTVETGDESADAVIAAKLKALNASAKLMETWVWARRDGGACLLLGADDGRDPKEPLDFGGIRSLDFLTVLFKRELQPSQWYSDPNASGFGEPSVYRLTRSGGSATESREVHASRLIRFNGVLTDRITRQNFGNGGWYDSVLQGVFDKLQQFNGAYAAVNTLLQDSSQGVFKVKNLWAAMSSDASGDFKRRMQAMDMMRSIFRSIMVDAEHEDYTRVTTAMSGVPDTLDKAALFLAGAAGMPVTILFGQAPAGLNATGESDTRGFYDDLKCGQTLILQPRLEWLVRVAAKALGIVPQKVEIKFNPLRQPTPSEDAELRGKQAVTDQIYLQAQVLTPEEVTLSRFGQGGYSLETTVDAESRQALLASDTQPTQAVQPEGVSVQQTALNGAQVASLLAIVQQVAARAIPRETGIALMVSAFPISREEAEGIMGPVGSTFFAQPVAVRGDV